MSDGYDPPPGISPGGGVGDARPKSLYFIAGLALLLMLAGVGWYVLESRRVARDIVTSSAARLTPPEDDGGDLPFVDRAKGSEVYFRVTLADAPVGESLSLGCDWTDPAGTVVHQNRYRTREIDRATWTTWCRNQFGPGSPPGTWTVTMTLDGRGIAARKFDVRDGRAGGELESTTSPAPVADLPAGHTP